MESEKAKEIKKALECCTNNKGCEPCPRLSKKPYYLADCRFALLADILTLINELESENKRLNKAINSVQKGFDNGEFISKDCKIRTLKEFAEKLKNNCAYSFIFGQKFITEKRIDELLKEYEK